MARVRVRVRVRDRVRVRVGRREAGPNIYEFIITVIPESTTFGPIVWGGVLPGRVRVRVPLCGVLAAWAGRRRPRTILVGLPLPLKDNPC